MDYPILLLATLLFAANCVLVVSQLMRGLVHVRRRSLVLMGAGFALQCWVLWERGTMQGRCPITSVFEILVFMSWAIVGWYFILGPTYRLSLLGFFTSALVVVLQGAALLPGVYKVGPDAPATGADPWIELHGSLSLLAYAAFGAAAIAGLMFLIQDHALKARRPRNWSLQLPPIRNLFQAMMLVTTLGGILLAGGMAAGYAAMGTAGGAKLTVSWVVLGIYALLITLRWRGLSHRRVAIGAIVGFVLAVASLWIVT